MKCTLPDSSDDLLIKDGKSLMRSLSLYEVIRRFNHIIRLTPFRFEDFTAALIASDQSTLLAEVHIHLLKSLIREDRQQQTWLGPPDIRDAINLYLHLADHTSWPSALRLYLSADTSSNEEILNKLAEDENKLYPFNSSLEIRLSVLEQLCDQFLLSVLAREDIVNGFQNAGKNETICRSCNKGNGDLIGCSNCPATYHLKCSDPPLNEYPDEANGEEPYTCPLCCLNRLIGVTDCISEEEKSGYLRRHEPLGLDETGRRYWFIARRLFIVDELEDDVRYYSSTKEYDQLLESVQEDADLHHSLETESEEIKRQMLITENLRASLLKSHKKEDGTYSIQLGQDGTHRCYINHYTSGSVSAGKLQLDKDLLRTLQNKFCVSTLSSFKWFGATDGSSSTVTVTIRTSMLKFESNIPTAFIHPCWRAKRIEWIRQVNSAQDASQFGDALSRLECGVKPIFFKSTWYETPGFIQLFRSTQTEREELKKSERQPRGFERNERVSADFELCNRLGTFVKFSTSLKPVKHQVWKQKGEEYRLTGLNGWYWQSKTRRSPPNTRPDPKTNQVDALAIHIADLKNLDKTKKEIQTRFTPKLPPYHDFRTRQGKVLSILVLPKLELRRISRSGGLRETRSFSYTAKQNSHIWPYGMTPRPVFRSCWLYRNQLLNSIQDVALQLKVFHTCMRWDDLQVRPPPSGKNTIVTDESTIIVELLKKRETLPYLTHSEYLIRRTTTPNELPEPKKRKTSSKHSNNINGNSTNNLNLSITPSRSGLRARKQVDREEEKGPKREEIWVKEDQLELWELKQFDEKIERQNALSRERALREEAERRRRLEEEKRRSNEQERRKIRAQEEAAKRARMSSANTYSSINKANMITTPAKTNRINIPTPIQQQPSTPNQVRGQTPITPSTPVLRYFRTEGGQIIRLPASYLQLGTPLILRHVNPSNPSQTNTYIIRPQAPVAAVSTATSSASPSTSIPISTTSAAAATSTINTATTTTTTNGTTTTTSTPESPATSASTTGPVASIDSANTEASSPSAATPLTIAPRNDMPTKTDVDSQQEDPAETDKPETPNEAPDPAPASEVQSREIAPSMPPMLNENMQSSVPLEPKKEPSLPMEVGPLIPVTGNIETEQEQKETLVEATESVGTVANELAHDQHAPKATPPPTEPEPEPRRISPPPLAAPLAAPLAIAAQQPLSPTHESECESTLVEKSDNHRSNTVV